MQLQERSEALPGTVPSCPDARQIPILANPKAGSGTSQHILDEFVNALRGRGFEPAVCWQREKLSELLAATNGGQIRCVVAAGGDGTLLEILNRAPGLPTAVLPLGNENLVARFCQIRRNGPQLAEIIAAGHTRRVDLARANGRLFALMAGAGFDAEVVHRVHHRRQGHTNRFWYALSILQALEAYSFPRIAVEIDETGERLHGAMVFVFNLPLYALDLPLALDARPDDGLLDVCVFERAGVSNLIRYVLEVVRGRHKLLRDFQHRLARRVRLTASQAVPLQTDGDPAGCLAATVEVVPGAMTLIVPARS